MGGKDTVVVDEDADIELAAQSIFTSAFGFADKNVLQVHVQLSMKKCMIKY